ncbi:MAG: sigma-70 family RNA polymerase sigma factor [Bacteroidota bacterium]
MNEDYAGLIQAIRAGDQSQLRGVYEAYRDPFIGWATRTFKCEAEEAKDIFQEVILIFYENIVEGKIDRLKSHIRTYLFGIGRILMLQAYRKSQRYTDADAQELLSAVPDDHTILAQHRLELDDQQKVLQRALRQLGEACRRLLELFYYRRFTTEAIMHALDYRNTDVVKSQKARCMKQLKKNMAGTRQTLL